MIILFILSYITEYDNESIIKHLDYNNDIIVRASGSSQQDINGSKQMTKPEYAFYPFNKKYDWCSNCLSAHLNMKPWIQFELKDKVMEIDKYLIRAGCCNAGCCCQTVSYCSICCLYSWSLSLSLDNETWIEVHNVTKEQKMEYCTEKVYKLDKPYQARYAMVMQTTPCVGQPYCLGINKVDFYGHIVGENDNEAPVHEEEFVSFHDDDDPEVSIIGHISKPRSSSS